MSTTQNNVSADEKTWEGTSEAGLIRSWANAGFSIVACLGEILINSVDAKSKNTAIHIPPVGTRNDVKFIDTGTTFSVKQISNMLTLYLENHASEFTGGKNGIGFKAAAYNLSRFKGIRPEDNKTKIYFFCNETGHYYKFSIDWSFVNHLTKSNDRRAWSKAVSQSKNPVKLTDEEKDVFLAERTKFGFNSTGGVTITVPFSEELYENLKTQFNTPFEVATSSERLDHILGTLNMETYLLDELDGDSSPKKLELYKPFNQLTNQYHRFVEYRILYQPEDKAGGPFWYLAPPLNPPSSQNRGWSFKKKKKLAETARPTDRSHGLVNAIARPEESEFELMFRITLPCFTDEGRDYWWKRGQTEHLTQYESKYNFFKPITESAEDRSGMHLNRNGQFIASLPLDDFAKKARQVSDNFLCFRVRSSLSYKECSHQDNPTDRLVGIQSNKNQYRKENFPPNLKKFLRRAKMVHSKNWKKKLDENTPSRSQRTSPRLANTGTRPRSNPNPVPQNSPQEGPEVKTSPDGTLSPPPTSHHNRGRLLIGDSDISSSDDDEPLTLISSKKKTNEKGTRPTAKELKNGLAEKCKCFYKEVFEDLMGGELDEGKKKLSLLQKYFYHLKKC